VTIILDSDIVIELLRGRNQYVVAQWGELIRSQDLVLYSPVTAAEVWAGMRPHEHDAAQAFFQVLKCAPIDCETGRHAGDYLREFSKSHKLEVPDAIIAATASQTGARLWTRNRKHFPMKDLSFY
jgi:predicted nucleic acid-binding protein